MATEEGLASSFLFRSVAGELSGLRADGTSGRILCSELNLGRGPAPSSGSGGSRAVVLARRVGNGTRYQHTWRPGLQSPILLVSWIQSFPGQLIIEAVKS